MRMRWKPFGRTWMRKRDELIGCKGHELVSCAAVGAIVLVPEGDAVLVERNQPAVGDGDAVGIARQIGEHRLWSAERGL